MPDQDTECAELTCANALRDARAAFAHEIVLHARKHFYQDRWESEVIRPPGAKGAGPDKNRLTTEDLAALRSDEAHKIAEFYFLIWKYKLDDRENIRFFLHRHNEAMRKYIAQKEKRDLIGFPEARARDAIFSEPQIERVVQNISYDGLRLDQADIGRLMSLLMSPETTRKTVVVLAKGGLLKRINTGHVLVISTGTLERSFENHLRIIVGALKPDIHPPDIHPQGIKEAHNDVQ
jgi:hypothetical protein